MADAESLEAGGEGLTPGVIGQQSVDQSAECFRSGVVLREVDGGFLPGEDQSIVGLMVFGGGGQRNEDGGDPEVGEFGQAGGAGTGQAHVGDGVGEVEPRMKGGYKCLMSALGQGGPNPGLVIPAAQPDELDGGAVQHGQSRLHRAVHPAGPLAAAHDQKRHFRRIEAKKSIGRGAIDRGQHGSPQRCAHYPRIFARKMAGTVSQTEQHHITETRRQAVGFARNSVGFVDERARSQRAAGQRRRQRRKSTHAQHGIRAEIAQDF